MAGPTKSDLILEKLLELTDGQAAMRSQMSTIQTTVTANTLLLRGNGVPGGIVTEIALMKEDIADLRALLPDEVVCRKDMKVIKTRVEDFPTYLWLLRFKPKTTLTMTAVVVVIGFFVVTSMVDHGVFAALMTWIGIPAEVARALGGK